MSPDPCLPPLAEWVDLGRGGAGVGLSPWAAARMPKRPSRWALSTRA